MNELTRNAIKILETHGSAFLTTDASGVDGKGKSAKPFVNLTTAKALERRGLARLDYDGENSTVELLRQR